MSSSDVTAASALVGEDSKKTSWLELVGKTIKEAREIILKDKTDANIVVLPAGSPMTLDYRTDRVRIFVDTVAGTPYVG